MTKHIGDREIDGAIHHHIMGFQYWACFEEEIYWDIEDGFETLNTGKVIDRVPHYSERAEDFTLLANYLFANWPEQFIEKLHSHSERQIGVEGNYLASCELIIDIFYEMEEKMQHARKSLIRNCDFFFDKRGLE